jgi:hypothetical protein
MSLQSIKKAAMFLFIIATVFSCNNGLTLQTYYVDNELKPGFTSLDVPTSFLNIEETNLTEEQQEAYKSVDKLNMLAFMVSEDNKEEYQVELAKVKTIFEDAKYEELMRGGNSADGNFVVKFLGDADRLDELILFGNANNKGFAIVRVLGDDMNAGQLVQLAMSLENADIKDANVSELMDFFN